MYFYDLQLSFGKYQADEQAWVDTIKSAGNGATIRISTMDWLGQSQYMKQTVYWSSLSSAVSEVSCELWQAYFPPWLFLLSILCFPSLQQV